MPAHVTRAMDALTAAGYESIHFESFIGCITFRTEGFDVMVDDYTGGLPALAANQEGWTVGVYTNLSVSDRMAGSAQIQGDTSTNALLECILEALREARKESA